MGIHWRAAFTEAPWSIEHSERHHGQTHVAILRIMSEMPSLAPDLALSMAYNARNDAPRAHGVSLSTSAMSGAPRLHTGDNTHADSTIAWRARAMKTARATMERFIAADRLRGALSHPGTIVPYVDVGQEVWFHRERAGWLRGTVHALDGKTVHVRRNGKIFSSHEAGTKPYVVRRPRPAARLPPAPPTHPTPPIRTHTPAPAPEETLPPSARVYAVDNVDPDSQHHPRWDEAKRTELAAFDKMDCKMTVPASSVPPGTQIFNYVWRVQHKTNRSNGSPNERARFCLAGNLDWHKDTNVPTSPVTPQRAIRTLVAVAIILGL